MPRALRQLGNLEAQVIRIDPEKAPSLGGGRHGREVIVFQRLQVVQAKPGDLDNLVKGQMALFASAPQARAD